VLSDVLTKLSNERVKINIMRASVGAITESDVLLASASNAVIIGFNVRPERKAQELAEQEKSTSACTPSFTNCRTRSSAP
jgi:translation initiation factor IF-2